MKYYIDMENWFNINDFHNETPLTVITINNKTIIFILILRNALCCFASIFLYALNDL